MEAWIRPFDNINYFLPPYIITSEELTVSKEAIESVLDLFKPCVSGKCKSIEYKIKKKEERNSRSKIYKKVNIIFEHFILDAFSRATPGVIICP